jgi:hypothetical protein
MLPELTELAERKLCAVQERTRTIISQAESVILGFSAWHTTEYAPGDSQQAVTQIAKAHRLCEKGTYLHYVEAERLATTGLAAAEKALARQKNALAGRLKTVLTEATQEMESVRPFARKHASEWLAQAEREWNQVDRNPASYDDFTAAFRALEGVKAILAHATTEGEKTYSKKRTIGAGMGGFIGALALGAVGFFAGALVTAVIAIVICIPLVIVEEVTKNKGLADHVLGWIFGICAGIGGIAGAIIGAKGMGSTVMGWIKRE